MKKLYVVVILLIMTMLAASYTIGEKEQHIVHIGPALLSAHEKTLLQSYAMEDTANCLSFTAPKEVGSIQVSLHRFRYGEETISSGEGVTFGRDRQKSGQLLAALLYN